MGGTRRVRKTRHKSHTFGVPRLDLGGFPERKQQGLHLGKELP